MGNRFQGTIEPGAMPFLHCYFCNPGLSFFGRVLFGIEIGDFFCGLRAFRRDSIAGLSLCCIGMEFASEMVIKASIRDLALVEVPADLRPNPTGRSPHLRSWRDGWRHLRFMRSFSPRYAFLPFGMLCILGSLSLYLACAVELTIFTGTTSLLIADFLFFASCAFLSDYSTTRFFFVCRYGNHLGRGVRLIDRFLSARSGVDRLMRLSGLSLLVGMVLALVTSQIYRCAPAFARDVSQLAFLTLLFLSITFCPNLTGTKIPTLLAFQDR